MPQPAIWKPPRWIKANQGAATFYGGNLAGLRSRFAGPTHPVGLSWLRGLQGGGAPQPPSNPYAGLLNDYLNQQRADFAAQSAADKASLVGGIRRYLISYGELPDLASLGAGKDIQGYLKEALNPQTRQLMEKAEREGLSVHARQGEANQRAMRLIPAALAARGILRSGQTGVDLSQQAMDYKRTGYDTLNEMLNAISGNVSNFQNAERERQRALAEAAMQAAWQAAQQWGDSYFGAPAGGQQSAIQYLQGRPTGGSTSAVKIPWWNQRYGYLGRANTGKARGL